MDDLSLFLEFEDFDTSGTPPPPYWRRPGLVEFDIGADNHIDLFDAYGLALCFATACGTGGCGTSGCEPGGCIDPDLCLFVFDSDDDNDIDQTDWAAMAAALGGPATARLPGEADASRFGNPFLFTGQRYDPATGLYHFWARTYSPQVGRWGQRDKLGLLAPAGYVQFTTYGPAPAVWPIGGGARDEYAGGYSLYLYGFANPASFADPYGLCVGYTLNGRQTVTLGQGLLIAGLLGAGGFAAAVATNDDLQDGLRYGIAGLGAAVSDFFLRILDQTSSVDRAIDFVPPISLDPSDNGDGGCEFYYAWCVWANERPPGDQGKGWRPNAPCAQCYATCKATGSWPFAECPMGGPHGPRWPGPNNPWDPVWPTPGEY